MEPTTEKTNAEKWDAAALASAETQAEKKTNGKPPRSFTERMPCKLTDAELVDRGGKLADAYAEADALEAERKNTNDGFKAKIELVEQRVRDLAGTLRTKQETREVELLEEYDYRTFSVRVKRADTGEMVRERAMTKNERQEELPLDKASKKKDEAQPANGSTSITEAARAAGEQLGHEVAGAIADGAAKKAKRGRKKS